MLQNKRISYWNLPPSPLPTHNKALFGLRKQGSLLFTEVSVNLEGIWLK